MKLTYVIDNANISKNRRTVDRLNITLATPDVSGPGGAPVPSTGMPINLVIDNPSQDDLDRWVPGATVTADYEVTEPPATPAAK